MKVLVTGATGMVGNALLQVLPNYFPKAEIVAGVRYFSTKVPKQFIQIELGDYQSLCLANLETSMESIDVVIHVAAKTPSLNECEEDERERYQQINYKATLQLAKLADKCGVKRFIFISTIKVNGECTLENNPFTEKDIPHPEGAYAESKYQAEQGLLALAEKSKMEVVIIRPPLVYGPGVKGNFYSLIRWIEKPIPLPLGKINNRRAYIAIQNLIDFIALCVDYEQTPQAKNEIFLISDAVSISTTELLQAIAKAQKKRAWLFSIPKGWIIFFAKLIGKEGQVQRLFGNLEIEHKKAKEILGWQPSLSLSEQLKILFSRKEKENRGISAFPSSFLLLKYQRILDIIISFFLLITTFPLLCVLYILGMMDTGSPLFVQTRMGKNKKPFSLFKFRTMKLETPSVATHLVNANTITPIGRFLRKTKLDELPQLWNVFKGEMSMVGPRPNLLNQKKLIQERERRGIYQVRPGITGLAQINKIDMSKPEKLAKTDMEMLQSLTIKNYFKYLFKTFIGKGKGDCIKE